MNYEYMRKIPLVTSKNLFAFFSMTWLVFNTAKNSTRDGFDLLW